MAPDNTKQRRRDILRRAGTLGAVGLTATAGCVGDPDQVDDGDDEDFDTVQFGVLEPFTGDFADLAEERNQGERLAIEHVNASDEFDFEIEYEEYDTQLNAEDGITAATQAIERDGAQFLTGAISSSVALAINDIALDNEVIYTPGAAAVSITGQECNEYVFRFETSAAQIAEVLAQWTAENLGGRIMYSIADYAYGNSVKRQVESRMQEQADDYEEVTTVLPAEGATDFEAFITQLSDNADDADALVVGATGGHLVRFLLQAYERGLHEEIPIVTTTGSFAVVRAGATDAAQGIYSGTRYVPSLETGNNQQFVSDYEAEYDAPPDNFSRVGYGSIMMVAQGIREAGSRDPNEVRETMSGMTYESIFGDVNLRECDQQATNPVWMAENVAPDEGDIADVELLTELSGEDAAPACEDTGCNL